MYLSPVTSCIMYLVLCTINFVVSCCCYHFVSCIMLYYTTLYLVTAHCNQFSMLNDGILCRGVFCNCIIIYNVTSTIQSAAMVGGGSWRYGT